MTIPDSPVPTMLPKAYKMLVVIENLPIPPARLKAANKSTAIINDNLIFLSEPLLHIKSRVNTGAHIAQLQNRERIMENRAYVNLSTLLDVLSNTTRMPKHISRVNIIFNPSNSIIPTCVKARQ